MPSEDSDGIFMWSAAGLAGLGCALLDSNRFPDTTRGAFRSPSHARTAGEKAFMDGPHFELAA